MVESSFPASSSAFIISLYICIIGKSKYKCDAAKDQKKEIHTDNKECERQINYGPFKHEKYLHPQKVRYYISDHKDTCLHYSRLPMET